MIYYGTEGKYAYSIDNNLNKETQLDKIEKWTYTAVIVKNTLIIGGHKYIHFYNIDN